MNTRRPRPTRSAVFGGALAVVGSLLTACSDGGSDDTRDPTALEPAAGAALADGAERLALALARDEPCAAIDEAEELERRASSALADGTAPEVVVDETVRIAAAVTVGLSCEDDGDEPDDADADGTPQDDPATSAPEPVPDPAPTTSATAPPSDSGQEEGTDSSGGPGGPGNTGGPGSPGNADPPGADRGGGPPPGRGPGQGGGP